MEENEGEKSSVSLRRLNPPLRLVDPRSNGCIQGRDKYLFISLMSLANMAIQNIDLIAESPYDPDDLTTIHHRRHIRSERHQLAVIYSCWSSYNLCSKMEEQNSILLSRCYNENLRFVRLNAVKMDEITRECKMWDTHRLITPPREFMYLVDHTNEGTIVTDSSGMNFYRVLGGNRALVESVLPHGGTLPAAVVFTALPFCGALVFDGITFSKAINVEKNKASLILPKYEQAREEGRIITGFHDKVLNSKRASGSNEREHIYPPPEENTTNGDEANILTLESMISRIKCVETNFESNSKGQQGQQSDSVNDCDMPYISSARQIIRKLLPSDSLDLIQSTSSQQGKQTDNCDDEGGSNERHLLGLIKSEISSRLQDVTTVEQYVECRSFIHAENQNQTYYAVFLCSSTILGAFKTIMRKPNPFEIVFAYLKVAQKWIPLPDCIYIDDSETCKEVGELLEETHINVKFYPEPCPEELDCLPQLDLTILENQKSLLEDE